MSVMPHVITGLAGFGSSVMASRAQTQAGKQAAAATREASAASERTLVAQMQAEAEQRRLDREDAQKRWEAEQAHAQRVWEASEDERKFARQIFLEDRAAKAAGGSGGGYSGPSGPDPRQLRKDKALMTLQSLMAQGTPGIINGQYVPATSAGPLGRG